MSKLLPFLFVLSIFSVQSKSNELWQKSYKRFDINSEQTPALVTPRSMFEVQFNEQKLVQLQNQKSFVATLPMPDGTSREFKMQQNGTLPLELQAKFPQLKTYTGIDVQNSNNRGHFEITPKGFTGMFVYEGKTAFIDPKFKESAKFHLSYYRADALPHDTFPVDKIKNRHHEFSALAESQARRKSSGKTVKRTYRLAVAAAAEYTQFHGGTSQDGMNAIVIMVNRLNQVFLNDLGIEFTLVPNNDLIVYTDPNTDPFNNDDGDGEINITVSNDTIGESNYDVGHVVTTGGGGLASLGVICTSIKADGVTGLSNPINDPFVIDYVAHELGHQFGADHTYNTGVSFCAGSRSSLDAYEPGSGSTIMSYVGICSPENLQNQSDDYFHARSLEQINNYLATNRGSSCGTFTELNNETPTISAGNDYHVPANTPFTLTATASDSDDDNLFYTWEQYDPGSEQGDATTGPNTMIDNGSRPIFRSFKPTTNNWRTFPKLDDVLDGSLSVGEAYATTNRELNFRVTVRDGQGGVAFDNAKLTVNASAGPFELTMPQSDTQWTTGSQNTVQWQVANTNQAPINCAMVDIFLSQDGGLTYGDKLLTTENDGEVLLQTPVANSQQARLKIQCSDNVFFAISPANFRIEYANQSPTITSQSSLEIDEDSQLQLSLSDIEFTDVDSSPEDISIIISSGENYQVSGNSITPEANFSGVLSVQIQLHDGTGASNPFDLKVTVNEINDAPVAVNDTASITANTNNNQINVIANDTDVEDSGSLVLSSFELDGNGVASIESNTISYTPAANFVGQVIINYTITDSGGLTANASLVITVNEKATPPTNSGSSGGGGSLALWSVLALILFAGTQRFWVRQNHGK